MGFFVFRNSYSGGLNEYQFSSLLKNTLDWISRPESRDEPILAAYDGKVSALCAASPGGLGGLRGLVPLRMFLSSIRVTVIPEQFALSGAMKAFDENNKLSDQKNEEFLRQVVSSLIKTSKALKT